MLLSPLLFTQALYVMHVMSARTLNLTPAFAEQLEPCLLGVAPSAWRIRLAWPSFLPMNQLQSSPPSVLPHSAVQDADSETVPHAFQARTRRMMSCTREVCAYVLSLGLI